MTRSCCTLVMEVAKMSSILRALNKLEKNPQEKTAFKPWQRKADARKTSGRGIRGMRLSSGAFYAFLAAPFLLIGGWLLLEYGPALMKTYLSGNNFPGFRIPLGSKTFFIDLIKSNSTGLNAIGR